MKPLIKAEMIQLVRNWQFGILGIGMPVFFLLIFTSILDASTSESSRIANLNYMLQMTSFSISSFALFSFPIILREDANNHYLSYIEHSPVRISSYYLAKVLRVFVYFICSIAIICAIGHFIVKINLSLEKWIITMALLFLTGLVYLACGLLIGQIKNMQTMSVVANATFLGLAVIGGTWFPITLYPDWLQHISKITPSYFVNELVSKFAVHGTFDLKASVWILAYTVVITIIALFIKKQREII